MKTEEGNRKREGEEEEGRSREFCSVSEQTREEHLQGHSWRKRAEMRAGGDGVIERRGEEGRETEKR